MLWVVVVGFGALWVTLWDAAFGMTLRLMMTTTSNNEVILYQSIYHHGIDDKRRVQIPAKWRPSSDDVEFMLILWPQGTLADVNLMVLPPARAAALLAKIQEMPTGDPAAMSLRRLLGSKSDSVKMDKAGRIMIPEVMAKKAGLDKETGLDREAVLVGLVDRFEIWNPDRYQKISQTDEALLSEAFKLI